MELQLPRGMRDFTPAEKLLRNSVVDTLRSTFERYGFNPLETPVVERWEVLSAKYGGGAEILKETYRFQDQGQRELGLRYDLTTPLARFVGMNPSIKKPFKRYHIGTVYRDGPLKKGRYREFYQCDVDTVGAPAGRADAECILLALDVFKQLNLKVEIRVNDRGLLLALAETVLGAEDERAIDFVLSLDKLEKIGQAGVSQELVEKGFSTQHVANIFAVLDVDGSNQNKLKQLQNVSKFPTLSGGWSECLGALFDILGDDERVRFVPTLARGLGYYTGTVFEVFMADASFDGSLAAGGRYDGLISDFLGTKEIIPAVGISFGLEPILELLKERQGVENLKKSTVQVYVIPIQTADACWAYLSRLRAGGLHADIDLVGRGPSANFKYANAYGIPYALVVGPEELKANVVTLKNMQSGEEERLPFEQALEKLSSALRM